MNAARRVVLLTRASEANDAIVGIRRREMAREPDEFHDVRFVGDWLWDDGLPRPLDGIGHDTQAAKLAAEHVWLNRPASQDSDAETGAHHRDDRFGELNVLHLR